MELAINTLPENRFYRFRSLDPERPERTSRIFTHDELYFPSPNQLNDPWDSKPNIVVGEIGGPAYKAKYVAWAFRIMMEEMPENNFKKVREWLEKHTQEQAEEFALEHRDGYHGALEAYRICSFSNNATHPLLWSHYSDSHKGFCLEFDASTDIFGPAMKITYQNEYPSMDITEDDNDVILQMSALTKAKFWKYEGEYRLISMEPNEPEALPVKDHVFQFPRHLLTGVIFGCRMPQAHKDMIMRWCGDRVGDFRFKNMVKIATAFELEMVAV